MLRAHRDTSLRPTDAEITCAMGVLVRTDFSAADADKHLFLRHRAAGHAARSSMAWQYVSTLDALRNDSRFAVVPCPDGPFATTDADEMETAKQGSCACKTLWWFRRALVLFPEASFIGKMEDDSVVHSARLVSELRHAAARWDPRGHGRRALLWYGFFQWSGWDRRTNGWFCGEGDQLLTSARPNCPTSGSHRDTHHACTICTCTCTTR